MAKIHSILFLMLLTATCLAQDNGILTYELINQKILSDSLINHGFKMYWKSNYISEEDVISLKDSIHYQRTIVIDSSKNIIDEFWSWYGDSSVPNPISLDEKQMSYLQKIKKPEKWKKNKLLSDVDLTRTKKSKNERLFIISRPIFFDNEKAAILTFYFLNNYAERYFIQIYRKDNYGNWIKSYEHLLWL